MNLLFANDRRGEHPSSWYAATAAGMRRHPVLKGTETADVCVVGAGYTGLSAALHLAARGYSVTVVEAHRVGFGASGRNGGQVGSGQRLDQDEIERIAGRDAARRLWDLAEEAKATVRGLIERHAIAADYRPGVAHACYTAAEVREGEAYAEKLARDYGYTGIEAMGPSAFADLVRSPVYKGGAVDWGAGHLHPLNYAIGLGNAAADAGVRIHENSLVHRVVPGPKPFVQTEGGRVDCRHIVLACNGYLGGLDGHVAARVMPINNFIVATEPLGERADDVLAKDIAVADTKFVVNYFRLSADRRLLFGGGESYGWRFPDIIETVKKPMLKVFPQLRGVKIDYAWGGTLAITMSRLPLFARPAQNVYSASGYSGHGVALATLAGKLIAEAVAGEAERFDLMASLPTPRFPGGVALRWPVLVAAMTWYSLRDRLGI